MPRHPQVPQSCRYPSGPGGRHHGSVKPPPQSLPSAHSRKWHNRRWWDPLGYLRVRTLANEKWDRDIDRVIHALDRNRPNNPGRDRELIDQALREARAYRDFKPRRSENRIAFDRRREAQWEAILRPLDTYLEYLQEAHLQAVDEAGCSGRS